MTLLYNGIISLLSTLGFAVLFNIPRRHLLTASVNGALGWILYTLILYWGGSAIPACFVGAVTVGLVGELLANLYRKPATIFIIPGIIPFVPGYGIFYTMNSIMLQNFTEAVSKGSESLLIAVAIASGLIVSSSLGRIIRTKTRKA
jgi:uncharacterized membrane protein YjjB (DUF3815 family)